MVGCDLCLNACPTGAIVPDGDHVAIDPYICVGHGSCASVCPTGAISFDMPRGNALFERLRVLSGTYRGAGGADMALLVHDPRYGADMISAMARNGRGLPARVVPFAVNEITQIGLDFLLTALAYGICQIRIVAGPEHRDALDPLRGHMDVAHAIMDGLGYGGERVTVDAERDPSDLERSLYADPPPAAAEPARHRVMGDKRTALGTALDHLHAHAPSPAEVVPLGAGAPFGQVIVNQERCTLCLSCVGVCPTRALNDNPERPQLGFTEVNCVQCGLCRATCPEDAITLEPRLNFARAAKEKIVLKEEEPFGCIRCGKPFATQSTIDLLVKKLEGHSMFSEPGRLDIIKMCEDCRVIVQFERTDDPFAGRRPAGAADHRRLPARTRGRPGPPPLQGQAALTMPDFWKLSGYHLLERDRAGALRVTDAFLRAYLERPEIRPIAESCAAEIALFERLMAEPRMPVPDQDLAAFADPDAAENYGVFLRFRDWLAGAPSLEAAYLSLVRGGGGIPPLFVDHIVQVILRGILEDCDDPLRLRAAELLFRSQKVNIADGAIMLADDETVETQAASAAIQS